MSSLPILDLVAGMIFIYFLLSIINNSLFEIFAAGLKLRAKHLETWIKDNFPGNFDDIVNHPVLTGVSKEGKSSSYMHAKQFTSALIEIISTEQNLIPSDLGKIEEAIKNTNSLPPPLKRTFLLYIGKARAAGSKANSTVNDMEQFFKEMENWFDHTMQRLTGKLKRYALLFTIVFGTILTITGNVDSIAIMNYLYHNPEARKEWAASAYAAADKESYKKIAAKIAAQPDSIPTGDSLNPVAANDLKNELNAAVKEIKEQKALIDTVYASLTLALPIGWGNHEQEKALFIKTCKITSADPGFFFWLKKTLGWVITILALCLGAPFWFDVLGKVANIRSSLKPQTAEEAGKK